MWHFATKCAAVNSQSFQCRTTSANLEIPATLTRSSVQNAPGKIGEVSPAGYTHGKRPRGSSKDQMECIYLWPCLVPSWCWASRNIWDCCWPWGISSPPRAAGPRTLPWRKVGVVAWWFATYNVEFVIAIGKWTWANGESLLLLCRGSSTRLSHWYAQGDAALWLQQREINEKWIIGGSIHDKLIFHIKQASRFRFHANKSRLSASKCLQ